MKIRTQKKVSKHIDKLEDRYDKTCDILDSFEDPPHWAIGNMIKARNKLKRLYRYWKYYPHPSWKRKHNT